MIAKNPVPGEPYLDSYLPALLEPGLYHADGQIDGEVYEYGSFLQSRMYAAGVTCSNCHDPHSAKLRAAGNALCAQCHMPEKFDVVAHHHHPPGSSGAQCVNCHMPTKNYMVVDARRDHSTLTLRGRARTWRPFCGSRVRGLRFCAGYLGVKLLSSRPISSSCRPTPDGFCCNSSRCAPCRLLA